MPGFRPRQDWVDKMKRYGILPEDTPSQSPLDVYAVEHAYWQSLWHESALR